MNDRVTPETSRPGRSLSLVALLFGLSGRRELSGGALRTLLGDLGLSDDAARAQLSRMRRGGQLDSTRSGREASYRMAGSFARGFEYIARRGGDRPPPWGGAFHTVLYRVPERSRAFRDALRHAAVTSGYGVLQPGVLVSPRDRREHLEPVLAGRPPGVQVLFGRLETDHDSAARVVRTAWATDELAATYDGHVEGLRRLLDSEPIEGAEGLRRYAGILAPALSATLGEPAVPLDLLPEHWPGPELRRLADACARRDGPTVASYVASVVAQNTR